MVGSVGGGGGRAWEPGSLGAPAGNFLPSLGSLERLKETGPQEGPGRPETGQRGKQGKRGPKLPIYKVVFPECPGSRLKPLHAKNQSFVSDNLP